MGVETLKYTENGVGGGKANEDVVTKAEKWSNDGAEIEPSYLRLHRQEEELSLFTGLLLW